MTRAPSTSPSRRRSRSDSGDRDRRGRLRAGARASTTRSTRTSCSTTARSSLGAKQNRILNLTVLVAARSEDADPRLVRRAGTLERALRPLRARAAHGVPGAAPAQGRALLAAPLARGVAQGVVWDEVARRPRATTSHSPTGAQADIFARATTTSALRKAFPPAPGQCGALLALGDRLCLDSSRGPRVRAPLPEAARAATCSTRSSSSTASRRAGELDASSSRRPPRHAAARAVRGARRRRSPGRRRRRRLRARARRRAGPALGVLVRRRAGGDAHRGAAPSRLKEGWRARRSLSSTLLTPGRVQPWRHLTPCSTPGVDADTVGVGKRMRARPQPWIRLSPTRIRGRQRVRERRPVQPCVATPRRSSRPRT